MPYCNAVASMLHAHQGGILVTSGAHLHGSYLPDPTQIVQKIFDGRLPGADAGAVK